MIKKDAYQSSAGQFSVDNLALREIKHPQRGQRDVFPKLKQCESVYEVISGNNKGSEQKKVMDMVVVLLFQEIICIFTEINNVTKPKTTR